MGDQGRATGLGEEGVDIEAKENLFELDDGGVVEMLDSGVVMDRLRAAWPTRDYLPQSLQGGSAGAGTAGVDSGAWVADEGPATG